MSLDVRLLNLPMDGRVWRVDWIGQILRRSSVTRELEVEVAFTRMYKAGDIYTTTHVTEVCVASGSEICGLPLGSLWRNGMLVETPQFAEHELAVSIPSPKRAIEEIQMLTWRPILPYVDIGRFGSFVCPEQMLGSRYLKISGVINNICMPVFIPLFEIARSWYLRDSELSSRLLSAPIEIAIEKLADISKSSSQGKYAHICLRDGLAESALPTVAMLTLLPHARKAAKRLISTYSRQMALGARAFLEALPPIQGRQTLRARGELICLGSSDAFFVYSLTAVPLPWLPTLEWTRETDAGRSRPIGLQLLEGAAANALPQQIVIRNNVVNVSAGHSAAQTVVRSTLELQTALLGLPPIRKAPSLVDGPASDRLPKANRIRNDLVESGIIEANTGAGDNESTPRPTFKYIPAVNIDISRLLVATFDTFDEVVDELGKFETLQIQPSGGTRQTASSSLRRRTVLQAQRAWALVEGIPRQAVVVQIRFGKAYFYLIEIQRRFVTEEIAACVVWSVGYACCSEKQIDRILSCLADGRGSGRCIRQPFLYKAIAHKFSTARNFAAWVMNFIARAVADHPQSSN